MRLSKIERLLLANQYRILETVDAGQHDWYARMRIALEEGYVFAYDDAFQGIFDGLDEDACRLVVTSMSMFKALQRSYDALEASARSGIDEWRVSFPGFDGNNETPYMGYAESIVEHEKRFTQLRTSDDTFNSHIPMVAAYQRMLSKWKSDGERYDLSRDNILALLARD